MNYTSNPPLATQKGAKKSKCRNEMHRLGDEEYRAGAPAIFAEEADTHLPGINEGDRFIVTDGRNLVLVIRHDEPSPDDLVLAVAEYLDIPRQTVQIWSDWVESCHQCAAIARSGQRCKQSTATPYEVSVEDFDPDIHLYCRQHQNPDNRGQRKKARRRIERTNDGSGFVYLLRAIGTPRFKIGLSNRVELRASTIARQNSYPVEIVHVIPVSNTKKLEALLHRRYADYRVHGEWFELPLIAVKQIKQISEVTKLRGDGDE